MENLNEFELDLLTLLGKEYPAVLPHIPALRVTGRESTGVGMFVDLAYVDKSNIAGLDASLYAISTNQRILLPELEFGLGYEVTATDGWLDMIEIASYGESWDGNLLGYQFEE